MVQHSGVFLYLYFLLKNKQTNKKTTQKPQLQCLGFEDKRIFHTLPADTDIWRGSSCSDRVRFLRKDIFRHLVMVRLSIINLGSEYKTLDIYIAALWELARRCQFGNLTVMK